MLAPGAMALPSSPAGAVATHGDTGAVAGARTIDRADLSVRLCSGANVKRHRRRRSSSISADAGRDLPASADDQDVRSAWWKA